MDSSEIQILDTHLGFFRQALGAFALCVPKGNPGFPRYNWISANKGWQELQLVAGVSSFHRLPSGLHLLEAGIFQGESLGAQG